MGAQLNLHCQEVGWICWGTLEKINGREIETSCVNQALSLNFPQVCILNAVENAYII